MLLNNKKIVNTCDMHIDNGILMHAQKFPELYFSDNFKENAVLSSIYPLAIIRSLALTSVAIEVGRSQT
jgi:hypothetical protein